MISCQFENGNKASLRHVVVEALIVENKKVLLVKRSMHLTNPGLWAIPGGYLDRDENCTQAAIREAKEETGYEVVIEKLLEIGDRPDRKGEDRQNVVFAYLCHPVKKVSEPDDESSEIQWFDFDQLPDEEKFAFDHFERIKKYLL